MTLREATANDIEIIGALIKGLADYEQLSHEVQWTIESLGSALFGAGSTTRVTLAIDEGSGEVAGLALWYPTFSTFRGDGGIWLEDLFVWPKFRGAGHGMALLHDLRARTTGRVEWMVLDWNEPSIRLYESLGAQPVAGWTRFRWLSDDSARPV